MGSTSDPYAHLWELTREILRPSGGSQTVLVVCGYRFGDSHVNLEIDKALRESAGRLTVLVFSSESELSGQLKLWHEEHQVQDQVVIFAKCGFFHGDTSMVSATDLPWWRFENITRLLGGER